MKRLRSFAKEIITDSTELEQLLLLSSTPAALCQQKPKDNKVFPLQVPRAFALRMSKKNIDDPLLLQVLPRESEYNPILKGTGYSTDPLQETEYSSIRGVVHKYHGRVLLQLTICCPINCRFCFRRYCRSQVDDWPSVFAYISNRQSISEVVLSGGEPLLWTNESLNWLFENLANISHVQRVRIHTRLPIIIPQYITDSLLQLLLKWQMRFSLVFVVHCNHPQEIDAEVAYVLRKLRSGNFTVLNQTVLLKGINDSAETLVALNEKLFTVGVLPYYLHLLDKVAGAEHFCVNDETAKKLMNKIRQLLPGYLVPRLVRDEVGALAKTLV